MKKDKVKVWKALMVSEEVRDLIVIIAKKNGLTVDKLMKNIFYGERTKKRNNNSFRERKQLADNK